MEPSLDSHSFELLGLDMDLNLLAFANTDVVEMHWDQRYLSTSWVKAEIVKMLIKH